MDLSEERLVEEGTCVRGMERAIRHREIQQVRGVIETRETVARQRGVAGILNAGEKEEIRGSRQREE